MNEIDHIALFKNGDERSFKTLFFVHYQSLCSYAFSLVKDRDEAEELVQDLFCHIWEKREHINIEGSVQSYLSRSVRNKAFNLFRHNKVKAIYTDEIIFAKYSSALTSEQDVLELQRKLEVGLARLPELSVRIFNLSREEGLSYAQIAAELDISVKTVEAHISRTLKHLRIELSEYLIPLMLILLEYCEVHRVITDSSVI